MCFCSKHLGEVPRGKAWALVTGAAKGIGRQYAEQLAERGYNIYMVDILEDVVRDALADALRDLRERNKNTRVFNSGLGISIFRDNSTRTRFSFASACNFLGLEEQVLDEKVSQIAHGETVRETANMVSFMADVIGIRDDMFIGEGHKYMKTFMDALDEGYQEGILEQRPTLVNLQCDVDHPTQCMADMLHIIHYFGGVENLKGKKVAMTWAYSPSYGKPLSVPQGVVGLFTRFGMDVTLAHPEGYEIMPEIEEIAKKNAAATGGSFTKCNSMAEAFKDADIVYPKSWASFAAMEKRTELYGKGDFGRTIDIATRCGQDSDCNPASAGGILGTAIGYDNIPEEWLAPLRKAEDVKFAYTNSSLNDTYRMSYSHALQLIEREGGKVSADKIGQPAVELLTQDAAVFASKGEMRKLVQGGGVSLNKEKLAEFDRPVTADDLIDGKYLLVQRGKKNYYLVIVK